MKKHAHIPGIENPDFTDEDIAIMEGIWADEARERARKAGLVKPPGSVKTPRPVAELGTIAPARRVKRRSARPK
jgi:hypothetical protein